jgi:hypothetical protein
LTPEHSFVLCFLDLATGQRERKQRRKEELSITFESRLCDHHHVDLMLF